MEHAQTLPSAKTGGQVTKTIAKDQNRGGRTGNGPSDLPQLVPGNPLPFKRTIRRTELRQIVPLADTTIYDMERRGEFPRRFNLTARCVVWDLAEVELWLAQRRQASDTAQLKRAPSPDVRQRKHRPVKTPGL